MPGIFLVLLAALFSRGRFAGRRARAVAAAAMLAVCLGVSAEEPASTNAAPAAADGPQLTDGEVWNRGVDYYRAGTDGEVWNRGVDYYRAGDMTNALATLRPLMLSRTHGARAAEVVGAIRHADRAKELAKASDAQGVHAEGAALEPMRRALAAGEESAWAMQRALRDAPDDPRANRNFTRVTDGLAKLRDDIHVEEVLAQAKGRDPKAEMAESARKALALLHEQAGVLTNEASVAIARSEDLAKRAEKLADVLIPLKRSVLESVTNEQQAAEIVGDVEATRDAVKRAAEQLADMSPDAAESLSASENAFHRYWKGMLDSPSALVEALRAQSNAVTRVERENGRDWQQEALDFTQIFGGRFQEWVQQRCAQDVATTSNEPPYTVHVAQEIAGAAQEIAKKQQALLKEPKEEDEKLALAGLTRVRDRCGLIAGDPRQLAAADLLMQTNAYIDLPRTDGFDWQKDAYDSPRGRSSTSSRRRPTRTCRRSRTRPRWPRSPRTWKGNRPDASRSSSPPTSSRPSTSSSASSNSFRQTRTTSRISRTSSNNNSRIDRTRTKTRTRIRTRIKIRTRNRTRTRTRISSRTSSRSSRKSRSRRPRSRSPKTRSRLTRRRSRRSSARRSSAARSTRTTSATACARPRSRPTSATGKYKVRVAIGPPLWDNVRVPGNERN